MQELSIGHPVHGREPNDRLRDVMPEAHGRHSSTATDDQPPPPGGVRQTRAGSGYFSDVAGLASEGQSRYFASSRRCAAVIVPASRETRVIGSESSTLH